MILYKLIPHYQNMYIDLKIMPKGISNKLQDGAKKRPGIPVSFLILFFKQRYYCPPPNLKIAVRPIWLKVDPSLESPL